MGVGVRVVRPGALPSGPARQQDVDGPPARPGVSRVWHRPHLGPARQEVKSFSLMGAVCWLPQVVRVSERTLVCGRAKGCQRGLGS